MGAADEVDELLVVDQPVAVLERGSERRGNAWLVLLLLLFATAATTAVAAAAATAVVVVATAAVVVAAATDAVVVVSVGGFTASVVAAATAVVVAVVVAIAAFAAAFTLSFSCCYSFLCSQKSLLKLEVKECFSSAGILQQLRSRNNPNLVRISEYLLLHLPRDGLRPNGVVLQDLPELAQRDVPVRTTVRLKVKLLEDGTPLLCADRGGSVGGQGIGAGDGAGQLQ